MGIKPKSRPVVKPKLDATEMEALMRKVGCRCFLCLHCCSPFHVHAAVSTEASVYTCFRRMHANCASSALLSCCCACVQARGEDDEEAAEPDSKAVDHMPGLGFHAG